MEMTNAHIDAWDPTSARRQTGARTATAVESRNPLSNKNSLISGPQVLSTEQQY